MRRFLLTTCMSAALLCVYAPHDAAMAQAAASQTQIQNNKVSVRTGLHDGYTRLVFNWQTAVPYTIARSATDGVDLVFKKAAEMDLSRAGLGPGNTILGLEKLPGAEDSLSVRVKIPAGSTFRHFLVGNRMVLDVYATPSGQAVAKTPTSAPVKAAETKAEEDPQLPVAETLSATAPAEDLVAASPPATVPAAPPVIQLAALDLQPHAVTISSTSTVGLAAFERHGDLWIVMDRSDINVPPQLSGPQKDRFSPFEKIPLDGGVAYRTRMPEGLHIAGEGGGLIWKMNLTPEDHGARPVPAERQFKPGETIRGGTLFWPMQRVTKVLKIQDPDIGDTIMVGTVTRSDQFTGPARNYVDFTALHAPVGIAILPKTDDVTLNPLGNGVQVTRPGGLALSRMRDVTQKMIAQQVRALPSVPGLDGQDTAGEMRRIFDFDRWMMGGLTALRSNQQVLLSGMATKDHTGRVQDLLMLAKMNLANDRGQEAVGFLNFAAGELPAIADSPEFLALRGAAEALAGKFEAAIGDLTAPALKDYDELDYWRAYTLAGLEDWQQARDAMPDNFDLLLSYPRRIQERLGLKLAEIALRSGDIRNAEILLSALEKERNFLQPATLAGLDYLNGERYRQARQAGQAAELWRPLTTGQDDLYRAKSGLALTLLQLQNKEITREAAIDRLEGLRYHWRGDELEAQVNFTLGKMYLEDQRYLKGFTILRDATVMSPNSEISREIASYMADHFKNLFLTDRLKDLSAVDAVTVYEEFRELTPPGDEGNRLVQRLAERLVDADLLGRAAALLQHQVNYRLTGREGADVALRLAGIDLLNDNGKAALEALDKAQAGYAALDPKTPEIVQKQKEAEMLRARALSELGRVDEALKILNTFTPTPDINRLRADIAWNAGMWEDAADALRDLVLDQEIDVARPLTEKQADLLLNRAVALNLAGDRVALAGMRNKYGEAMGNTARSKMFDVVTRQRTGSLTSDRESIAALVSEVDIFKDFLDSYRASTEPSQ